VKNIALGSIIGLTAFAAFAVPSWIEFFTGWDLDRHDGSIERSIVAVLLTMALAALALAVMKRRAGAERPLRRE
jgi:uncharacterized membrane protein